MSCERRAVGILMSGGVLDDGGVRGLSAIRSRGGGTTLVQHPDDALFADMPCHALEPKSLTPKPRGRVRTGVD